MTKERIAELRALCASATPGPWYPKKCQESDGDEACGIDTRPNQEGGEYRGISYSDAYDECSHFMYLPDARLICESRTAVPELCDALEAAMRVAEAARSLMESWDNHHIDEFEIGRREVALNHALGAYDAAMAKGNGE